MKYSRIAALLFIVWLPVCISCNTTQKDSNMSGNGMTYAKGSYGFDREFLRRHIHRLIELGSRDGKSRILVSGDHQGRVMTSTASGDTGNSFGWLNYDLISSTEKRKQFNPVGGEERFWMGPEGGQYSLYFKSPDSFTYNNWQVPVFIDTDSFAVLKQDPREVTFQKDVSIKNYSGASFDLKIERKITLLNREEISEQTGVELPDSVSWVAYQTSNKITNTGNNNWVKENGLLSVWLLGMFTPTPSTVVIIPFKPVSDARKFITGDYFGPMPAGRLSMEDSVMIFTCDGRYRSKIGVDPKIAKPIAAGFDFQHNQLTLVIPEIHPEASYVNSKWEFQENPYKGDVVNAYNDGPLEDGTQMGPFYEIESSSPALSLKKGESSVYSQTTIHISGSYTVMKQIVLKLTGLDPDKIKKNYVNE